MELSMRILGILLIQNSQNFVWKSNKHFSYIITNENIKKNMQWMKKTRLCSIKGRKSNFTDIYYCCIPCLDSLLQWIWVMWTKPDGLHFEIGYLPSHHCKSYNKNYSVRHKLQRALRYFTVEFYQMCSVCLDISRDYRTT